MGNKRKRSCIEAILKELAASRQIMELIQKQIKISTPRKFLIPKGHINNFELQWKIAAFKAEIEKIAEEGDSLLAKIISLELDALRLHSHIKQID